MPELDTFVGDGADVSRIQARVARRLVARSDDDPLVPSGATDRLAADLDADLVVVPDAGHFLADDGYDELPVVRDFVLGAARIGGGDVWTGPRA